MAKEVKQKKEAPKVEVPHVEKAHYFPKFLMLFSLFLIAVAVINYFNFYQIPSWITDVVLLLAGLWMFKVGLEKGYSKRRREIVKKYI
jgi:hypothetical protein